MTTLAIGSASVSVVGARVQVPAWGRWWADLDLASALPGLERGAPALLELGGVTLHGAVVTGGTAHGRATCRLVGGSGGWSTAVAARAYRDSAGVKRSAVIADAAGTVGETVEGAPTTRVGPHFARTAGPASRVLHELAPREWYVDLDGVTRFGARAATTYTGTGTRVSVDPRGESVELVVSDLTGLVPGVVVDDLRPATDVEYVLTAERLSARVYGGPRSSRDLDAFRLVLDALDPRREYRGVYDYRVVTQSGATLNLQPVRASAGKPDLERVPVRLAPGVRADHLLGSLVSVVFLDSDPSRPRVITGDDDGAPGWMPVGLELGETPVAGVARLDDPVEISFSLTVPDPAQGIQLASATGGPVTGTIGLALTPVVVNGKISGASTRVKAGT